MMGRAVLTKSLLVACVLAAAAVLAVQARSAEDLAEKHALVRTRVKRLEPVTLALLSTGISAGASLGSAGIGALLGTGFSVELGLEVENYSKHTMNSPDTHMVNGYVSTPARTVLPSKREAMVVHKAGNAATGAVGVVLWRIGQTGYSVVAMFSMPYSFDLYSNYLAVGIRANAHANANYNLYKEMYYDTPDWFARKDYYYSSATIEACNSAINMCVQGAIGTSHKAKGRLHLIPNAYDDLAPNLKNLIDENEGITK